MPTATPIGGGGSAGSISRIAAFRIAINGTSDDTMNAAPLVAGDRIEGLQLYVVQSNNAMAPGDVLRVGLYLAGQAQVADPSPVADAVLPEVTVPLIPVGIAPTTPDVCGYVSLFIPLTAVVPVGRPIPVLFVANDSAVQVLGFATLLVRPAK
jgi:hypothetical protein